MKTLLLNDDELALLRFTCDLFFVAESPIFYIDHESREPADFEASYHSLINKGIVNPKSFRLTDNALNRLAPLTECDARIIVTRERPDQNDDVSDYYLLDEIAVSYAESEPGHIIGKDRDHDELMRHFARQFSPRRSGGDFIDVELEPGEYLVFALLSQDLRALPKEDRMSMAEITAALSDLGMGADDEITAIDPQTSLKPYALRGAAAFGQQNPITREEPTSVSRPLQDSDQAPTDLAWDKHLINLERKAVVRRDRIGQAHLMPAYVRLARHLSERGRTTFIRYDFIDEDWLIRETSFLPVEGSLFFLGPTPDGLIALRELDAERLELSLRAAIGPLALDLSASQPSKTAKDFFLRA